MNAIFKIGDGYTLKIAPTLIFQTETSNFDTKLEFIGSLLSEEQFNMHTFI